MRKWEAKVTINDGFPIQGVMIFNVEADSVYAAIAMGEICAKTKTPNPIAHIEVEEVIEGERSRPDKMIYFIKEGYKKIPQSKKYLEMEAAHERAKQEANSA